MLHFKLPKGTRLLSHQVRDQIIEMIKAGEFSDNKLPAESKLAVSFGVSVAIVREALLLLSHEGIVTKKHGSGNYFHLSAINADKSLNQYPGFRTLLQAEGYQVHDTVAHFELKEPTRQVREFLRLRPEEKVLFYERTIFADGEPAIHCDNWLPEHLFTEVPGNLTTPLDIFDVFWRYFGKEMAYSQMKFIPYISTELETEQIGVPTGQAIIIMGQIYYSLEDIPMGYSYNKFNHNYIQINMRSH
ncbi:MAG: GntR family transcriptional regulator [Bacillota bacterium]